MEELTVVPVWIGVWDWMDGGIFILEVDIVTDVNIYFVFYLLLFV